MKKHNFKQLIPREKSRNVIYLKRRGRGRNLRSPVAVVFGGAGVVCIAYCAGISIAGFGTWFFLIWGGLGVLFLAIGGVLTSEKLTAAIPGWVKAVFWTLFILGVLLFGAVEGMILTQYNAQAEPGADYCIVLGAQWKTTGPSEVLRRRLDAATAYLNQNPHTKVIVSGGQGGNEVIAEAAGMREYLIQAGIDETRILVEDRSTNTFENLIYSGEFLDRESARVVIVTNNFHVFRALSIAKKQGYGSAEGLAASSDPWMAPNNLLREFLGVIKDFVVGNL